MILSDTSIIHAVAQSRLGIEPFNPDRVQPASYDITLASKVVLFYRIEEISLKQENQDHTYTIQMDENGWLLCPNQFILAESVEYFEFPNDIAGRLEGRSSLGRLGLVLHVTAGFFDPGFCGTATLEMTNLNNSPIRIFPGLRVGQMSFFKLDTKCNKPYGHPTRDSKYTNQKGAQPSKIYMDAV